MKEYGEVYMYIDPHFLFTSALAGVARFTSRPFHFLERAPGTHWMRGWVRPRAGLDDVKKRKFLPHRDSNFNPLVVQPVPSRYTDYAIPVRPVARLRYS
jgi:hypothetical protein